MAGATDANDSQWKEKASSLFRTSSANLKAFANKAGTAAAGAAEVGGTRVKAGWATTRQEWSSKVQPRVNAGLEKWNSQYQPKVNAGLETAARVTIETGTKLKTGLIEARDKAAATKMGQQFTEATRAGRERALQATRNSYEKSRTLLARVNFRQQSRKEQDNPNAVFGVPLSVLMSRQVDRVAKDVPRIVLLCATYLTAQGLSTMHLFENEGSNEEVIRLMKLFDQDPEAHITLGTSSLDVAQLLMVYFRSLPEPLLAYDTDAALQSSAAAEGTQKQLLRELLLRLPPVNQCTLKCLMELLYQVSEKEYFNKMDTRSLATLFAPLLVWNRSSPPRVLSPASSSYASELQILEQGGGTGSPLAASRRHSHSPSHRDSTRDSPRGGRQSEGFDGDSPTLSRRGLEGSYSTQVRVSKGSPLLDNSAAPSVLESPNGRTRNGGEGRVEAEGANGSGSDGEAAGDGLAADESLGAKAAIVDAILCLIENHDTLFRNLRPIAPS
eukprot:TRINITY_DN32321_c0_g1_i1.p1 TRINITY_DN32321_c0_g1~~TRINITY_DN32321_c0_g1_i1.p1  ORF type:complete len:499 (-),score=91.88 TRINITY_DN32321_c0_g1_i1:892-2388(-)